jgi:plastocyanin
VSVLDLGVDALVSFIECGGEVVRVGRRYRIGSRYIPLAVMLGVGVASLPSVIGPRIAGSETTPQVEAVNTGGAIGAEHAWSPAQVTVAEGGTVAFQNSSAVVPHGVEWVGGPGKPACSSGVPVGTSAEPAASGTNWSGTCSFAKPGVYTFYCTVHGPEMTGRITVSAAGATTVTVPGMAPTTTPGPTAPGAGTPPSSPGQPEPGVGLGSPLAGSAAQAVKLAKVQRRGAVRGSVQLSQAGVGGRLQVDLFASAAAFGKQGRTGQARAAGGSMSRVLIGQGRVARASTGRVWVGRLVRSALDAGRVPFAVALTQRGRTALRRRGSLALTVRIVLTPTAGAAVTVTRNVIVRVERSGGDR